jgi:hypothetical protein
MKYTFAHVVWGIYPKETGYEDTHWFQRRTKIDNDVRLYQRNPYTPKSVEFIYGEENYKRMVDLGFDCRLVDKRPIAFNMETEQYAHKLFGWQYALQEFDACVFLDFDCIACQPIPSDFWDVINEGEPVKAALYIYHLRRVNRPPNDYRKVSSATMVYLRGKEHADGIIQKWLDMGKPWKEEYPLSTYIDGLGGGWKGVENYKKYDLPHHVLSDIKELNSLKKQSDITFVHINHNVTSRLLSSVDIKSELETLRRNSCPAINT